MLSNLSTHRKAHQLDLSTSHKLHPHLYKVQIRAVSSPPETLDPALPFSISVTAEVHQAPRYQDTVKTNDNTAAFSNKSFFYSYRKMRLMVLTHPPSKGSTSLQLQKTPANPSRTEDLSSGLLQINSSTIRCKIPSQKVGWHLPWLCLPTAHGSQHKAECLNTSSVKKLLPWKDNYLLHSETS